MNEQNLDVFRREVTMYAELDNLIKEVKESQLKPIQDKIKELVNRKKELEKKLCTTLGSSNSDLVKDGKKVMVESASNGIVLEYQVKKAIVPINQKSIKEKMIDFFTSGPGSLINFNSISAHQKASELHAYIYDKDNRNYVSKEDIKVKPLFNSMATNSEQE